MFEIGTTLRDTRLRRQLDLVDAETDTKIRSKYLAALENEEFDLLPGAVYTRGFLRTYARYLGLDAQCYIDEYNERFGRFEDADDVHSSVLARPAPDLLPKRGPFTLRRMAVLCLVLMAGLAWLGLREDASDTGATSERSVVAGSELGPLEAAGTEAGREQAGDRAAAETSNKPVAARPGLVLRAIGASTWVEVRRGGPDGALEFSGTLAAGKRKAFQGPRHHVSVGVASAAQLRAGTAVLRGSDERAAEYLVTPGRVSPL